LARQLKLFLAYSSAREALVSAFHEELKKKVGLYKELHLHIEPWTDRDTVSEIIIEGLIDHCRGSNDVPVTDFFAVFLTNDDLRTRVGSEPVHAPRDNCVFELGLFLGGMGFDKRRCFVISSVPESVLPTDIRGWKFIQFTEPPPGSGPQADRETATALATEIRDQIYNLKDYTAPAIAGGLKVITGDELMRFERPIERGGQLVESAEVLVNRAQPVELSQAEFAAQVSSNIRAGINYRYFFHDLTAYPLIARLLFRVVTANFDENGQVTTGLPKREVIQKFLNESVIEHFSIGFLPSPGPIEFCIHNADVPDSAVCYLRLQFQSKFLPWSKNADAVRIATELKEEYCDCDPKRIFMPTTRFDINLQPGERIKLWAALKRQFLNVPDPELEKTLSIACFGEIVT